MTIAAGMLLQGGVLLFADTLYCDGVVKEYHDKIFTWCGRHASVGFAIAGNSIKARIAVDDCRAALDRATRSRLTVRQIILKLRPIIKATYDQYVADKPLGSQERNNADFAILLAIGTPAEQTLWVTAGDAIGPISNYDCIGSGRDLGMHVLRNDYRATLTVDQACVLAIRLLSACKEVLDGIGGKSQFLVVKNTVVSAVTAHDVNGSEPVVQSFYRRAFSLLLDIGNSTLDQRQFLRKLEKFGFGCIKLHEQWGTKAEPSLQLQKALSQSASTNPPSTTADRSHPQPSQGLPGESDVS